MNKKLIRTIVGLFLAALFLFLTLKGKDINKIWQTIKSANIYFLFLTVVAYLLSFVARSEKWRIQVENLNYKVSPKSAYFAMMMHYFFNSFTPKLGSIARCSDLKEKNNVPFSACFASYMSEVIFDTIFLFIGLFLVIITEYKKIRIVFSKFFSDFEKYFNSHQQIFIYFTIASLALIIFIYFFKKKNYFRKYDNHFNTFFKSISKTFKIKKFALFFLWNIILWLFLFLMNYFLFKSIFDTKITSELILTITIFTYFGWLMPTPGGIGSVEYFVLQAFLLFGLNAHNAISFGILSNGITFFSVLIFSSFLILLQKSTKLFSPKRKL